MATAVRAARNHHNYLAKYRAEGDVLDGAYNQLYGTENRFHPSSPTAPDALLRSCLTMSNSPPKVYIGLDTTSGQPTIEVFNRPTYFRASTTPNDHDNRGYCFMGDLTDRLAVPGNFPESAFNRVSQMIRPWNDTLTAVRTIADTPAHYLPPAGEEGDAGASTMVTVRKLVAVPHRYLNLVLGVNDLTPKSLFLNLGAAILDNEPVASHAQYGPLLDWLCVAVTHTTRDGGIVSPLVVLGDLQPLVVDRHVQQHVASILREDFPHFYETPPTAGPGVSDELMRLALAGVTAPGRDPPGDPCDPLAKAYHGFLGKLCDFCDVDDPADLPPIHLKLAEANKSQRRAILQSAYDACSRASDFQVNIVATKEHIDQIFAVKFGHSNTSNKLDEGLTIYLASQGCYSDLSTKIAQQNRSYDGLTSEGVQGTLANYQAVDTKYVRHPKNGIQFLSALKATHVMLSVIFGEGHPHTVSFQEFAGRGAQKIINHLSNESEKKQHEVYSRVVVTAHHFMMAYLGDIYDGNEATLPDYKSIVRYSSTREWGRLHELPEDYVPRETPPPRAAGQAGNNPAGATRPAGTATTPTERTGGLGNVVSNDDSDTTYSDAFAAKQWTDFRKMDQATLPKIGTTSMCLLWFLKRKCRANCGRCATHLARSALPAAVRTAMDAYVQTQVTNNSN